MTAENGQSRKKVLVTGCFDLLHSGHVRFLEEAATYGDVYISLGNDRNVWGLKGPGHPMLGQEERRYMLASLRSVKEVIVSEAMGTLDGAWVAERVQPDLWIVNEDGDRPEKQEYCQREGIEYKVLRREPKAGLPARDSTGLKRQIQANQTKVSELWTRQFTSIPYRLALAGGWIDQPFMSYGNPAPPGSMVVVCIEPEFWFMDRAGICSSTRKVAEKIWGRDIPKRDCEQLTQELYEAENKGKSQPSGSQDMIGIICPGINRLDYNYHYKGGVYPAHVETLTELNTARWLESVLWILSVNQRPAGYDPLLVMDLRPDWVRGLGEAGKHCFEAIQQKDLTGLGLSFNENSLYSGLLLPHTIVDPLLPEVLPKLLNFYQCQYPGATYSSCGGGYLFVASEVPVPGAFQVRIKL